MRQWIIPCLQVIPFRYPIRWLKRWKVGKLITEVPSNFLWQNPPGICENSTANLNKDTSFHVDCTRNEIFRPGKQGTKAKGWCFGWALSDSNLTSKADVQPQHTSDWITFHFVHPFTLKAFCPPNPISFYFGKQEGNAVLSKASPAFMDIHLLRGELVPALIQYL